MMAFILNSLGLYVDKNLYGSALASFFLPNVFYPKDRSSVKGFVYKFPEAVTHPQKLKMRHPKEATVWD
jgi:hypothetical protein